MSEIKLKNGPVWEGPSDKGKNGGITYSLLSRYLCCKERFRIHAIEGWRASEKFVPTMDFGNMWHVCEAAAASEVRHFDGELKGTDTTLWSYELDRCLQEYNRKFPMQQAEIGLWYDKCQSLFPEYVKHWQDHSDVKGRTPLLQEEKFDVPYELPSGRVVRLRGKWDSVDLVNDGVWLQENKTKSQIDYAKVERQLRFDLQTMLYLIALREDKHPEIGDNLADLNNAKIAGVRYNVIRRAAHKTAQSMMTKFQEDKEDGRIGEWFARWNVEVTPKDIEVFKTQCLNPVLENLLDDYEWWANCSACNQPSSATYEHVLRHTKFPHHQSRHFRFPYGVYDVLAEGGFSDVDAYLTNGSTVGLRKSTDLFPELT